MFGECHGHIFMNGVDYHRAVALYAHGVDREDVKRKLQIYRNMALISAHPSMGYIKMDITGRLWDWDLIL